MATSPVRAVPLADTAKKWSGSALYICKHEPLFLGVYITPEKFDLFKYIKPVDHRFIEFPNADTRKLKEIVEEAMRKNSLLSNPNYLEREVRRSLDERGISYFLFNLARNQDKLTSALSPYYPF